jgi:SAM-dependent methyltransferase
MPRVEVATDSHAATFHDLQQGGYDEDLALYRELAAGADATLELGAGTGRVALHIADVTDLWACDVDVELLEVLARRATERGLTVTPLRCDATEMRLAQQRFDLILAPVNFVQIIGATPKRKALLQSVKYHLAPDGRAVLETTDPDEMLWACARDSAPVTRDGCTSRQLAVRDHRNGAEIRWERLPGPDVRLVYRRVDLEREAERVGLRVERADETPSEHWVGSTYHYLTHG